MLNRMYIYICYIVDILIYKFCCNVFYILDKLKLFCVFRGNYFMFVKYIFNMFFYVEIVKVDLVKFIVVFYCVVFINVIFDIVFGIYIF